MDFDTTLEYFEASKILEAEKTLVDLKVIDFPNLKQEEKRKYHNSIMKIVTAMEEPKELSTEELARMLNGS